MTRNSETGETRAMGNAAPATDAQPVYIAHHAPAALWRARAWRAAEARRT